MFNKWASFVKNENGATAIEYALIASLISIALIGGATTIGTALDASFDSVGEGFGGGGGE